MKKLPPSAADSCADSPTAVEATRAMPATESSVGSANSSVGAAAAPFTWVRSPASQASTTAILASAPEAARTLRSVSKESRSAPSSSPAEEAWPE